MTVGEVCEVIAAARILVKQDGTHPTAREIFEYSPTGELHMLAVWYAEAREALASAREGRR